MFPLLFDAHLDMAWNALEFNRNLMLEVPALRQFESQFTGINPGPCTTTWPELRRGNVGMTICTLLPRLHRKDKALSFYQSIEAGHAACVAQLEYYRTMSKRGVLKEIGNRKELETHFEQWMKNSAQTPIAFILSMEGAQCILEPGQIEEWFQRGLRILGPAHYGPNQYCHGTGSVGGLSEAGRQLIKGMDRVGMILDATHLSDDSFWQALEIFNGPVLASHHNCRSLVPADRQLTDEQIKALGARGAVIGAACDAWMITPGWKIGVTTPENTSFEDLANHTDHICQLLGTTKHCGIGSDLDGGFGTEQTPRDLNTIADLQKFGEILRKRGYSETDLEGIMFGNWIRFFREAWKV